MPGTVSFTDLSTSTPTGASNIVLSDGDGTQAPIAAVINKGVVAQPAATSIMGTDGVVVVQAGQTKVLPASDLPGSGNINVISGASAFPNITTLQFNGSAVTVTQATEGSNTVTISVSSTVSGGVTVSNGGTESVSGATLLEFPGASISTVAGGAQISITGGGGVNLTSSGSNATVTGATNIYFDNATVTGASGSATVTGSSGGGGGSIANDPTYGTQFSGGSWSRPAGLALTWVNQGGASYNDVSGGPLILKQPAHTSNNLSILIEAAPGGGTSPWTRTWFTKFMPRNASYRSGGVCMINASGNILAFNWYMNNGVFNLAVGQLSSATSSPSNVLNVNNYTNFPPFHAWRIQYDGTNYNFFLSSNGYTFMEVYTETAASFLGTAVSTGLFLDNQDSGGTPDQTIELWSEYSSTP